MEVSILQRIHKFTHPCGGQNNGAPMVKLLFCLCAETTQPSRAVSDRQTQMEGDVTHQRVTPILHPACYRICLSRLSCLPLGDIRAQGDAASTNAYVTL